MRGRARARRHPPRGTVRADDRRRARPSHRARQGPQHEQHGPDDQHPQDDPHGRRRQERAGGRDEAVGVAPRAGPGQTAGARGVRRRPDGAWARGAGADQPPPIAFVVCSADRDRRGPGPHPAAGRGAGQHRDPRGRRPATERLRGERHPGRHQRRRAPPLRLVRRDRPVLVPAARQRRRGDLHLPRSRQRLHHAPQTVGDGGLDVRSAKSSAPARCNMVIHCGTCRRATPAR